jgi:hypothetical protein
LIWGFLALQVGLCQPTQSCVIVYLEVSLHKLESFIDSTQILSLRSSVIQINWIVVLLEVFCILNLFCVWQHSIPHWTWATTRHDVWPCPNLCNSYIHRMRCSGSHLCTLGKSTVSIHYSNIIVVPLNDRENLGN